MKTSGRALNNTATQFAAQVECGIFSYIIDKYYHIVIAVIISGFIDVLKSF